jgi:hypothetical protein
MNQPMVKRNATRMDDKGQRMKKIQPTRKLNAEEKRLMGRTITVFPFLAQSEAELLTAYAEQSHRYALAKRETERNPTVTAPIFSRNNGEKIGERPVRNPAFANLREALTQVRLLEKRLTSLNDKRRAEAEREQRRKAKPKPIASWASEQARARAAHELQEQVEEEMRAGTFEPSEERIAILGQDLLRVGYKPASGERGHDLRTITLSWIESRYWAARPDNVPKSDGEVWVEKELIAIEFYDDLIGQINDSPFAELFTEEKES